MKKGKLRKWTEGMTGKVKMKLVGKGKKPGKPATLKHADDPRWDQGCNYCWLCLRHYYSYDHALKHEFCPTCKAKRQKAKKQEEPDVKGEAAEKCPIRRPKPRAQPKKVGRVLVAGELPYRPKSAKWTTLREWGEKTRDYFEEKGQFLTVSGLLNLVYRAFSDYDRAHKAAGRLKELYTAEWEQMKQEMAASIDAAVRREREAEERRRASLQPADRRSGGSPAGPATGARENARLGRAERKVLAVLSRTPMTKTEVRKAAKLSKVNAALARLVELGLAVKTRLGRYKLPRETGSENPKRSSRRRRRRR